jgi:oligoribonuclease
MKPTSNNLIWVDLEMTGLDVASDAITEIAIIVTDKNLKELGRWPTGASGQAIFQPESVLEGASAWVKENMAPLLDRVRASSVDLQQAQELAINFVGQFCPGRNPPVEAGCPLAGNSVGGDRAFLRAYLPKFEERTSYRNVDVSTIKELVKRWYPEELRFNKNKWLEENYPGGKHNAMVDLMASIAELEFYRSTILRTP